VLYVPKQVFPYVRLRASWLSAGAMRGASLDTFVGLKFPR
jgi:hypothetical protein